MRVQASKSTARERVEGRSRALCAAEELLLLAG
jgi:hypothetical protein